MKTFRQLLVVSLLCCLPSGCGTEDVDGDSSSLSGAASGGKCWVDKKTGKNVCAKADKSKLCYLGCLKKGADVLTCKKACYPSATDKSKLCYLGCLKKGADVETCKKACYGDKGSYFDKSKLCYSACLKKGADVETCKKACYGDKKDFGDKGDYSAKKSWDKSSYAKVSCKQYTWGGQQCTECWDSNGAFVKKYCK